MSDSSGDLRFFGISGGALITLADLDRERILRKPVLGGLTNE
jgi:hypothetical protein